MSLPLSDARTAGIGHDDAPDLSEIVQDAVTLCRVTDHLRAGVDDQLRLDGDMFGGSLPCYGGGTRQILVGGVGAGAHERCLHFQRIAFFRCFRAHLRDRCGSIGGERSVEMRLKGGEVYRDELVEIILGGSVYLVICLQVGSAGERHLCYIVASRLSQIVCRMAVEGEDGTGGTELGTHVADRGTARGGQTADPFSEIFKDGVGAAFDSQLAEDLKDHIFWGCPS